MENKKQPATPKPLEPKKGQVVRVHNRGGIDGYRRAGVKHPKGPKDWPHDAFTAPQLAALAADSKLDVTVADAPKPETAPAKE